MFRLSESHLLVDPDFHDGSVDALDVSRNQSAEITLTTAAGVRYRMKLSGLTRLRCHDFREGNIIFDVSALSNAPPPENILRHLLDLGPQENSENLQAIVRSINNGDLILFSISPSYGCELVALCDSVQLQEVRDEKG